jgi:hypothetical protein
MNCIRPACLLVLSALASSAQAATFMVTSLADSGAGSLRAAVTSANTAPGAPHTISFATGVEGTLTLSSPISITTALAINGPGALRLTLDGANATRLFRISPPNDDQVIVLTGLTLTRGNAVGSDAGYGGAIYKQRGTLRLVASNVSGNRAVIRGGAIYSDDGDVAIDSVSLINNETPASGSQGSGGALYMRSGTFTSNASLIANNKAEFGGGIALASPGNHAVIDGTLFQGNTASGRGGGLFTISLQSFRMSGSAFIDNAVAATEGGAFYYNGSSAAGASEGIIENTTFHGNSVVSPVGLSSALSVNTGALLVRNSTFAHNAVSPGAPSERPRSGALWVDGTDTQVKLVSVLFGGNTRGAGGAQSADIARTATTSQPSTLDVAHSLLATDFDSSVVTSQSAPNQFATSAQLLPLDRSVGLAPVVPIARTSPAIDRGANPGNLGTDQRGAGFVRTWTDPVHAGNPALSKADVGAYEFRGDALFVGDFERP